MRIQPSKKPAGWRFLSNFFAAFFILQGSVDMKSQYHLPTLVPRSALAEELADAEYSKLAEVRGLLQNGKYSAAEAILTRSLELFQETNQPSMEIATILKDRGIARQYSNPRGSLEDLAAAAKIYTQMSSEDQPVSDIVGVKLLRGQVNQRLSLLDAAEEDFSTALSLDEENPFLWSARGDNRMRRADWSGAAEDYLMAEAQFKLIGDKIRRTLAAADASIAMYGAGDKAAALEKMAQVGKQARNDVASNDPENIPRLQEIARKEAELHLVRAGLAWTEGKTTKAAEDWARGCIRLEGYAMDAANRNAQRMGKEADAARRALTGPSTRDQAEDVLASFLGMQPDSNYVKDRESDKPLWNQFVPGKATDFDPKAALPQHLEEFVGCKPFYDSEWVQKNRLWPPEIQSGVKVFVEEFDFSKIDDIKATKQFKVSWDEMK
jgi:tetratricopeptide (TPR) repeat protein